jgi:hypothetical protein
MLKRADMHEKGGVVPRVEDRAADAESATRGLGGQRYEVGGV